MAVTATTEMAIANCASLLTTDLDQAVDKLVEELLEALPEFADDDDVRREAEASATGNVAAMLRVFRGEDSAENVAIDPAVLSFGRTMARRRAPIERLIQSYRVGQALFWRLWMEALTSEIDDRDELVAALHLSSDRLSAYLDRVVSSVVSEYTDESDRWLRRSVARRAEAVERILRGGPVSVVELSTLLGHELRLHQTGLVLWGSDFEDHDRLGERLDRALSAIGKAVGVRPFRLYAGMSSIHAWIASPQPLDLDRLEQAADTLDDPGVHVAAGSSLPGVEGFRRSHEQALRAQRVAVRMTSAPRITTYGGIELMALLSHDENELGEFVGRELGSLAGRDASSARLRETVLVLLEEGGNARLASERLFTHKNTVLYRVQRAEHLLGKSVRSDTLSLQLALYVAHVLGDRVLTASTAKDA